MAEEKAKKPRVQLPEELKKDIKAMSTALSRALRFMTKIVTDDIEKMEAYYEKHGDIKHRPKMKGNPNEDDLPTDIDIVLKADSLGLPIKRLIDTISVIEHKLGGLEEGDLEPPGYTPGDELEEKEDRERLAQKMLDSAMSKKAQR